LQIGRVGRRSAGDKACVKRFAPLAAAVSTAVLLAGAAGAARSADAPSNTAPPSISGRALRGATLTASTGSWSGSTPMAFRFQWLRCRSNGRHCFELHGETAGTYRLRDDDVGHRLRVRVTAANGAGSGSEVSDPTGKVAEPKPPHNAKPPSISGSFRQGARLVASVGSWSGTEPISFAFQWQRCRPDGSLCTGVPGATRSSFTLTPADVGARLRVVVTGRSAYGSESARSSVGDVPVVGARGSEPANTAEPRLSGTAEVGRKLVLAAGTWKGSTPMAFAYSWVRCNSSGASCAAVGVRERIYTVSSADVGSTLRGAVTAANAFGKTAAFTKPTAVVTVPLPAGGIRLPSGLVSLPVARISPPERLVVDQVAFSPLVLRSRGTFVAQFRVRDTRGYVVRDALVYVVGVPFGRVAAAPEAVTGVDGVATLALTPTARLPLRDGGSLVLFVRARKPGDSLLAGVSARRLVSVRTASP